MINLYDILEAADGQLFGEAAAILVAAAEIAAGVATVGLADVDAGRLRHAMGCESPCPLPADPGAGAPIEGCTGGPGRDRSAAAASTKAGPLLYMP